MIVEVYHKLILYLGPPTSGSRPRSSTGPSMPAGGASPNPALGSHPPVPPAFGQFGGGGSMDSAFEPDLALPPKQLTPTLVEAMIKLDSKLRVSGFLAVRQVYRSDSRFSHTENTRPSVERDGRACSTSNQRRAFQSRKRSQRSISDNNVRHITPPAPCHSFACQPIEHDSDALFNFKHLQFLERKNDRLILWLQPGLSILFLLC